MPRVKSSAEGSPLFVLIVFTILSNLVLSASIENSLRRFPACADGCNLQRAYRSCLTYQSSCPCTTHPLGAPPANKCIQEACSRIDTLYLRSYEYTICSLVHQYQKTHDSDHHHRVPLNYGFNMSVPAGTGSAAGTSPPTQVVPGIGYGRPQSSLSPSFNVGTSAGVGVGAGILAIIVIAGSIFLFKRIRQRKRLKSERPDPEMSPGIVSAEKDGSPVLEKDGSSITELSPDEMRPQLPADEKAVELQTEEKKVHLASAEIHEMPS